MFHNMTEEQKQALITEWIAALRSGKYPKNEGSLHRRETIRPHWYSLPREVDTYCALGVLGHVAGETWDGYTLGQTLLGYAGESEVVDWNDHERLSFEEIADRIEGKFK